MEKTNKAGQIYPWEIKNYDYNTYYKFNQYSYNIQALYKMFGKAEKMLDDTSYFNSVICEENDEYPSDEVEQGKIFGAITDGPDRQVKMKPTVLTELQ